MTEPRGYETVDLQEVVDRAGPERPFVYMPRSSMRLMLRVDKPEDWCVATTGVFMRDFLGHEERNAGGIPVLTTAMMTTHGIPAKNLLVYGIGPLGANTKFAKMVRRHGTREGNRVVCISSTPPDPVKVFWLAAALGVDRKVFGNRHTFVGQFCEVRNFGFRAQNVVTGIRPDKVDTLKKRLLSFTKVLEA